MVGKGVRKGMNEKSERVLAGGKKGGKGDVGGQGRKDF